MWTKYYQNYDQALTFERIFTFSFLLHCSDVVHKEKESAVPGDMLFTGDNKII